MTLMDPWQSPKKLNNRTVDPAPTVVGGKRDPRYGSCSGSVLILAVFIWQFLSFNWSVAAAAECHAGNATNLAHCLASPTAERIIVDSDIGCGPGQDCNFQLIGRQGPFELIGSGHDRPRIYRKADYRGRFGLLVYKSIGPISIGNLIFDEGGNNPKGSPGGVRTNAACESIEECNVQTLEIVRSEKVTVSDVAFRGARNIALGVTGSSDITIRRSEFVGSWLYGV
jgi:hypothetical protein